MILNLYFFYLLKIIMYSFDLFYQIKFFCFHELVREFYIIRNCIGFEVFGFFC